MRWDESNMRQQGYRRITENNAGCRSDERQRHSTRFSLLVAQNLFSGSRFRVLHSERLRATATQRYPSTEAPSAGVAIMLIEIEEILSLNFNLFSPAQINSLRNSLAPLREMAELQTYSARGSVGKMVENPAYRPGREKEGSEIVDAIDAIVQQCNQARYFYLKNVLQQNTNLEVESDKTKVVGFLDSLGFDPLLTASLAKAEELYLSSSNAFDLKSCLGHIRSFYEHLNIDAGQAFARHLETYGSWEFLRHLSCLCVQ